MRTGRAAAANAGPQRTAREKTGGGEALTEERARRSAGAWKARTRNALDGLRPAGRGRHSGYTYLLVLFLVAALGLVAAETGVVWQQATQREREADLLAIGVEFARALGSYRDASADGLPPQDLMQLVEDRRSGVLVRHLRRVYRDPLTGQAEWGLEKAGGRIVGIYSLAPGIPIREHDLPDEIQATETRAERYAQWVFRPVEGGDRSEAAAASREVRAIPGEPLPDASSPSGGTAGGPADAGPLEGASNLAVGGFSVPGFEPPAFSADGMTGADSAATPSMSIDPTGKSNAVTMPGASGFDRTR